MRQVWTVSLVQKQAGRATWTRKAWMAYVVPTSKLDNLGCSDEAGLDCLGCAYNAGLDVLRSADEAGLVGLGYVM